MIMIITPACLRLILDLRKALVCGCRRSSDFSAVCRAVDRPFGAMMAENASVDIGG
jgi:hypothetical protein